MHIFSRFKVYTTIILVTLLALSLTFVITAKLAVHAAGPVITLLPKTGSPNVKIQVAGKKFGVSETVSLTFDTATSLGTATTDSTGAFTTSVTIPKTALPGNHTISAVGQTSGMSAQAIYLLATAWPSFGFDTQNSHFNNYENVISTNNIIHLTSDWSFTTGGSVHSAVTVDAHAAYVGSGNTLYAFDPNNKGALLWTATTGGAITSTPAVSGSYVYVGSQDSKVYAFDGKTNGTLVWSYPTAGPINSSPLIYKGILYIGSSDHKVYALNATTGKLIWSYTTGGAVNSSPAASNNVLYIGSDDNNLYAFNAATGALLWKAPTTGAIESSPAVDTGRVFVGSLDHHLYAFDAATGALDWSYKTGGAITASPATSLGVVYITSADDNIYAFNENTDHLYWNKPTGAAIKSSPTVIVKTLIFVTSEDNKLYVYNHDGHLQIIIPLPNTGKIDAQATIANGLVYVCSMTSNVYVFHIPGF